MRAATGKPTEGEVLIYGPISDMSFFGDEVTPRQFKEDLDALGDVDTLNVFINSPGGNVFASQAIHSILRRHKAEVIVTVDGIAASGASLVAMAGDLIVMPKNAMMMVHNPHAVAIGDASVMREMADTLDQVRASMVAAYREKTGLEDEEIISLLDAETWMTAEEAVEKGFSDEVEESKEIAASLRGDKLVVNGQEFDATQFRRKPPVPQAAEPPSPAPQPNNGSTDDRPKRPVALFERRLRVQQQTQRQKEMSVT